MNREKKECFMVDNQVTYFKRKICGERLMLMLPFNVVLVGRVRGMLDPSQVIAQLEILRSRHPMLAVRVEIEDDGTASFLAEDVPAITVNTELRQSDDQWLDLIKNEFQTPFPIETGPLVRCTLLCSEDICEVILCGHHTVCDGMSLGYLLRDLLNRLSETKQEPEEPVIPPPIDHTTVPSPPSANWFVRFIMERINKGWRKKNIRFTESDMRRMHEKFWQKNKDMKILAWSMEPESTSDLVERCRTENVTVNSALWTAFLAAQYDIQNDRKSYRQRSALAINTREKLKVPAGESFGFYASSLTVTLPYSSQRSFWVNARRVHTKIMEGLAKTNLFRMLSSELIHPILLDSLYFQKYGLLNETMPAKLLRKMKFHKITYGYALTNVGRFDIPTAYGSLKLEAVYGPLFYSDVEEKMIGVITVGGRLSFLFACNESVADDSSGLKESAMRHLEEAIGVNT